MIDMRIYNKEDIGKYKAEKWMIDIIKQNEHYVYWGCYEDYMYNDNAGWRTRSILESWEDMWELDEYNECVNYYFQITRETESCKECGGTAYNKETKKIADDFYDFAKTGRKWNYSITQDEVEYLVKMGRLVDFVKMNCWYDEEKKKWIGWVDGKKQEIQKPKVPLAQDVNRWAREKIGHDAINRIYLIRCRAQRLGVFGWCPNCDGKGYLYLDEKARLDLQLWVIHPRKGCSKGVYIKNIKKTDLPKIKEYLMEARKRNNERFKNIDNIII